MQDHQEAVELPVSPMKASRDMKNLVLVLAAYAVSLLAVVTWALTRISVWIVSHGAVYYQITDEIPELAVAAIDISALAPNFIPAVVVITSVIFFVLLWRVLPAPSKIDKSRDVA